MTSKCDTADEHEHDKNDFTGCSAQCYLDALKNSGQADYMPRELVLAVIAKKAHRDYGTGIYEFRDGSLLDVPNESVLRHSMPPGWNKEASCWPDEEN
jgi:hypothetical protein